MRLNPRAAGYQQRASDPAASAWVSANAGSGKTRVLVDRVIRLLLAGSEPSRLLCLTFTKAAAAEMALRISGRLADWLWLDDDALDRELAGIGVRDGGEESRQRARRLFARVQETPGGLKIQTIHAFCERLLQLFPVEAGVVPQFTVMDDRSAASQLAAARDEVLVEATRDPHSAIGVALQRLAQLTQADQLDMLLKSASAQRGPAHFLLHSGEALAAGLMQLRAALGLDASDSHETLRRDAAIDAADYRRAVKVLAGSGKSDQALAGTIARALEQADCSLLDLAGLYLTTAEKPRDVDRLPGKDAHLAHPWLRSFLQQERQRFLEAAAKHSDLVRLEATEALFRFAFAVRQAYEARKRARGHYDFDDLIARTHELLRNTPDAAWVLYKLDGGIDHVLLDEAQDTSPEQWAVVTSLTEEFFAGLGRSPARRTLFAVGDRKQSIFSFQGADPDVFLAKRGDFARRIAAAGLAFNDVDFTVSFRSVPEILKAVDTVFADGRPARAGLDGEAGVTLQHESNRPDAQGLVEIWDLEMPDDKPGHTPWIAPLDRPASHAPSRRLARRIAATIRSWLGRRHIAGTGRLVTPGDILILVRKRGPLFSQMISALRLAGVPVAGADRLKLGDNIAVQDLVALAAFATLPLDDYSLACVLKSPLLAQPFTEDELLALAQPRAAKSLWQALREDRQPAAAAARTVLEPLIALARGARPFDFFATALQAAKARFIARLGSEAEDAVNAFLQTALDYENEHAPSLAGFLAWFQSGETEIKRNMEQAAGEVRIMTVHGAKGLEAPIVILPDTTAEPEPNHGPQLLSLTGSGGTRLPLWSVSAAVDSDAVSAAKAQHKRAAGDEYRRLLYVAMTRACEELYVCGYQGPQKRKPDCWYDLVREALASSQETPLVPVEPGVLRYGATPAWDETARAAPAPPLRLPDWIDRPGDARSGGAARHSVTALAADEAPVPVPREGRPSRGLVMHRLLQVLAESDHAAREALALQVAARAGHPAALAHEALALLADAGLAPLFQADGLSEVLLNGTLQPEGLAVSGRIDRLIVTPDSVTIVDFKTDRLVPESPEQTPLPYLRQMALYARLLAQAYPGRPVRTLLLWTNGPEIMDLPESLRDRALRSMQLSRP